MAVKNFDKIDKFVKSHTVGSFRDMHVVASPFSIFCGSDEIKLVKSDLVATKSDGFIKIIFLSQRENQDTNGNFLKKAATFIFSSIKAPRSEISFESITRLNDLKNEIRLR